MLLVHRCISESLLGICFCCPVCVVLVPSVNVTSARELEKPESRHSLPRECVLERAVGFSVPWASDADKWEWVIALPNCDKNVMGNDAIPGGCVQIVVLCKLPMHSFLDCELSKSRSTFFSTLCKISIHNAQ